MSHGSAFVDIILHWDVDGVPLFGLQTGHLIALLALIASGCLRVDHYDTQRHVLHRIDVKVEVFLLIDIHARKLAP